MTQAIMCVECGASFQKSFPAVLAILVSSALFVTLALTGYFISQSGNLASENIADNIKTEENKEALEESKNSLRKTNESSSTIVNNISPNILRKKNNAILRVTKNIMPEYFIKKTVEPKAEVIERRKEEKINLPSTEKPAAFSGRISINVFSSGELRAFSVGCTYYEGRSKNNVVFFTTNVYGYLKVNGKVYPLQGIFKGNDIAKFAGAGFEVSIEIEGLAGNENAWVAEGTLIVKDVRQRTLSKHKIYSSCTDF
jgi:hypothetical protein